jgi:hypothetical protein
MTAAIEEQYAFQPNSSIYAIIMDGGGCLYGPGDKTLLADFLASYAERLMLMTEAICSNLPESGSTQLVRVQMLLISSHVRAMRQTHDDASPLHYPQLTCVTQQVATTACQIADYILSDYLDLVFGQHIATIAACRYAGQPRIWHIAPDPAMHASTTPASSALNISPQPGFSHQARIQCML